MSPGGEPERDDTGLPPVDIEIPDDARDLDRDVQAYHREQRAVRRQQRRLRFHGSLGKDGIVLPLLACCLILALITGTLLTIFTATSDQNLSGLPGSAKSTAKPTIAGRASPGASSTPTASASASASPAATAVPATVRTSLPAHATLTLDGVKPVAVAGLSRAVLFLVPVHCDCTLVAQWLEQVAKGAHAKTYLVYTPSTESAARRLYRQLGGATTDQARLAADPAGALHASLPASLRHDRLTAILVGVHHRATAATQLSRSDDPTSLIQALTH